MYPLAGSTSRGGGTRNCSTTTQGIVRAGTDRCRNQEVCGRNETMLLAVVVRLPKIGLAPPSPRCLSVDVESGYYTHLRLVRLHRLDLPGVPTFSLHSSAQGRCFVPRFPSSIHPQD